MDEKIEVLIVLVFIAGVVTGCQAANPQPGIQPEPTDETGLPTPPNQDGALSIQNPFNPVPEDDSLVRGSAFVDSVQWNNSQNAGQVELVFKGSLPTPCNQLRLNFLPLTADKRLEVDAYSVSKPDEVCIQMIQEFEATVTLTGLAQGDYTVFVNDQEMLNFNIPLGELAAHQAYAFTSIVQDILSNPEGYSGQEVVIVGYYRGWNLLGEASGQSPVTRSDWVIKDNSGAIYVSAEGDWLGDAGFVPGSLDDTTKVLRVTGVVRLTSTGQPYIEPTQVELIP